MAEQAGLWLRVSTSGQDEASQLPDCIRWCNDHGYEIARTYEVHGESAYKGEQDPYWRDVVRDVEDGTISVIVIWKVDRLDRQNILHAVPMVNKALEAGARIEFADQPYIDLTTMPGRMAFGNMCEMAYEESKTKSDRVLAKQAALRAAGSAIGRPPWGYRIERQPDGRKKFVPTDIGRNCIPLIYQKTVDGESLRDIAAWLTAAQVPTTSGQVAWNAAYIGLRIIRNPVYYGQRRNAGRLETEALVSPSMWQQANAAVASRLRTGRGTVVHEKALLQPECSRCGGPMYRIYTGQAPWRKPYYRCTGKGPRRKSCGARMIPGDELDEMICSIFLNDQRPHKERKFVPGDDQSDKIASLREEGAELFRQGKYAEAAGKAEQATELENMPRVKPHWEEQETGQTEAEYFGGLGNDERRKYLARFKIAVFRDEDGDIWPKVEIPEGWFDVG